VDQIRLEREQNKMPFIPTKYQTNGIEMKDILIKGIFTLILFASHRLRVNELR